MTKAKTAPLEALIVDCSARPDIAKAQAQIKADFDTAVANLDAEGLKTALRDLEELLTHEGPREARVALTDDEIGLHHAEQLAAHLKGRSGQIQKALESTDRHVLAALESGTGLPKPLAQHRAALRAAAATVEQAKTIDELDAIEIPAPPAH